MQMCLTQWQKTSTEDSYERGTRETGGKTMKKIETAVEGTEVYIYIYLLSSLEAKH